MCHDLLVFYWIHAGSWKTFRITTRTGEISPSKKPFFIYETARAERDGYDVHWEWVLGSDSFIHVANELTANCGQQIGVGEITVEYIYMYGQ